LEFEEAERYYSRLSAYLGKEFRTEIRSALPRLQRWPLAFAAESNEIRRLLCSRFPYKLLGRSHQPTMSLDSFLDFVLEQLAALDGLRCKRMFGGYGLYSGEVFFGIVFDGRLYFKTHADTLPEYLKHNAAVFAPSEKQTLKHYREVPVDILEDSEQLPLWARKAAAQ
jgi:DNA transformation protein